MSFCLFIIVLDCMYNVDIYEVFNLLFHWPSHALLISEWDFTPYLQEGEDHQM